MAWVASGNIRCVYQLSTWHKPPKEFEDVKKTVTYTNIPLKMGRTCIIWLWRLITNIIPTVYSVLHAPEGLHLKGDWRWSSVSHLVPCFCYRGCRPCESYQGGDHLQVAGTFSFHRKAKKPNLIRSGNSMHKWRNEWHRRCPLFEYLHSRVGMVVADLFEMATGLQRRYVLLGFYFLLLNLC